MGLKEAPKSNPLLRGTAYLTGIGLSIAAISGCGGSDNNPGSVENQTQRPVDTALPLTAAPSADIPQPTQQEATATPETELSIGQILVPFAVMESPAHDPSERRVDILFGLTNPSNRMLTFEDLSDLGSHGKIKTGDGYSYASEIYIGRTQSGEDDQPILPPGFSARFFAEEVDYEGLNPYAYHFISDIPNSVSNVYDLSINDDEMIHEGLNSSLEEHSIFPTNRPDSDFYDVGNAAFHIPQEQNDDGKELIMSFDSLTPVVDPEVLDPSGDHKLYSLKITLQNQSGGYDAYPPTDPFFDSFMVADDGGIYFRSSAFHTQTSTGGWTVPHIDLTGINPQGESPEDSGLPYNVGPGQSTQFEIAIYVRNEVSKAKLVLPGINGEDVILNLNF